MYISDPSPLWAGHGSYAGLQAYRRAARQQESVDAAATARTARLAGLEMLYKDPAERATSPSVVVPPNRITGPPSSYAGLQAPPTAASPVAPAAPTTPTVEEVVAPSATTPRVGPTPATAYSPSQRGFPAAPTKDKEHPELDFTWTMRQQDHYAGLVRRLKGEVETNAELKGLLAQAKQIGVDPSYLVSQYALESSYGRNTGGPNGSSAGARGVLQSTSSNAKEMKKHYANDDRVAVREMAAAIDVEDPATWVNAGLLRMLYVQDLDPTGAKRDRWGGAYNGHAEYSLRDGGYTPSALPNQYKVHNYMTQVLIAEADKIFHPQRREYPAVSSFSEIELPEGGGLTNHRAAGLAIADFFTGKPLTEADRRERASIEAGITSDVATASPPAETADITTAPVASGGAGGAGLVEVDRKNSGADTPANSQGVGGPTGDMSGASWMQNQNASIVAAPVVPAVPAAATAATPSIGGIDLSGLFGGRAATPGDRQTQEILLAQLEYEKRVLDGMVDAGYGDTASQADKISMIHRALYTNQGGWAARDVYKGDFRRAEAVLSYEAGRPVRIFAGSDGKVFVNAGGRQSAPATVDEIAREVMSITGVLGAGAGGIGGGAGAGGSAGGSGAGDIQKELLRHSLKLREMAMENFYKTGQATLEATIAGRKVVLHNTPDGLVYAHTGEGNVYELKPGGEEREGPDGTTYLTEPRVVQVFQEGS